jgi:LytS/YehU family sensor histidine kinase
LFPSLSSLYGGAFLYFLQADKILIPLSEEVKIVKAYFEIGRLRMPRCLQAMIQVAKGAEQTMIPILSVQPRGERH